MAQSEAFSKNRRLLKRQDFDKVFMAARQRGQGGSMRSGCLLVYWKNTDSPARLGLSVSKKVLKSAAKRNVFKRSMREFFRKNSNRCRADFVLRLLSAPRKLQPGVFLENLEILKKRLGEKC
ncbi:MAG: ribonuclease P protein component [Bradymonadales bacterium]|nr:MAG: ribonuclease P protein component [Bradymonadales bacterium]